MTLPRSGQFSIRANEVGGVGGTYRFKVFDVDAHATTASGAPATGVLNNYELDLYKYHSA